MGIETKRKPKILLVDDEADLATLMAEQLSSRGFDVQIALEGAQALFKTENEKYDCIITDSNMPKLRGERLIEVIQSRKTNAKTKMIIISGEVDKSLVAKVMKFSSPLVKIFVKPFSIDDLCNVLFELDEIKALINDEQIAA